MATTAALYFRSTLASRLNGRLLARLISFPSLHNPGLSPTTQAPGLWPGFLLDAFRRMQRETAALLTRDLRTGYAAPVLRSTMRWLTENRLRKTW